MRILFASAWFPFPPDNGSKTRVYHLVKALSERHEVSVAAFAHGTTEPDHCAALARHCQAVHTVWLDPAQRPLLVWAARFFSPSPVTTWVVPEMRRLVDGILGSAPFDVVIASTETMATYVSRVRPGCVRVLEEHNSLSRLMGDRYQRAKGFIRRMRAWVSWQKVRRYERRLFPGFDLVTMVSREDQQASRELVRDGANIRIVPNGVDCLHNLPGLSLKHPKALVYNGSLTYSANFSAMRYFLDKVYPLVRREEAGVSLTITGSAVDVDVRSLRLDESVRLSGHVDDVRPLVAESAVCVVPLREGGGTRLKILEAMALGTPVVSTSKGAEGLDIVPDEHFLVADAPAEFARATVRLLRDEALAMRLAQNARRLVEARYDWGEIGARFVDLVEEAVARRRAEGDGHA